MVSDIGDWALGIGDLGWNLWVELGCGKFCGFCGKVYKQGISAGLGWDT